MHPNTVKSIASMRAKCKSEADHKFVDSLEGICKSFESLTEPVDPFKNLHLGPKAQEAWDKTIQDLIAIHNGK